MATSRNQLRIIGGQHRGRRLPFPDEPGLRPTPDRVRETLFNWLAPIIAGARCLDAFAGSGVLGFEALSRGAAQVVMLERSTVAVNQLRANAQMLRASGVEVVQADALHWLAGPPRPFDLVLLDPPYAEGLLEPAIERLSQQGWLPAGARIYLEAAVQSGFPVLPDGWELIRQKVAGQVSYGLVAVG